MKAVVFVHTVSGNTFGEPVKGPDCLSRARALKESIVDDYPEGTIFSIGADVEAREDHKKRFIAALRGETIEIDVEDGNV